MKIEEVLSNKLLAAKDEFSKMKEYFELMVSTEINDSCFEKNAISALTAMLEQKAYIKTLKDDLALIKIAIGDDK